MTVKEIYKKNTQIPKKSLRKRWPKEGQGNRKKEPNIALLSAGNLIAPSPNPSLKKAILRLLSRGKPKSGLALKKGRIRKQKSPIFWPKIAV